MIIILCRIPVRTKKQDIVKYLENTLKGNFFKKSGLIKYIKILKLQNTNTSELECHGIVSIEPNEAGSKVIKKLNRKIFNGKHIAIREFIKRSLKNDKRTKRLESNQKSTSNNRIENRRRSNLEDVSDVPNKFIS